MKPAGKARADAAHADRWRLGLDREGHVPVYQQIANRITDAIRLGHFLPGERLPAERLLAADLGVARGTVNAAYALLAGQGSVIARKQRGTVVAARGERLAAAEPSARQARAPLIGIESVDIAGPPPLPYQQGVPAFDAFPRKLWVRVTTQVVRSLSVDDLGYPDPRGTTALRRAVARYVGTARGVACTVGQVYITPSHQASLALIVQALLRHDDRVVVEDPCYCALVAYLALRGIRTVPVTVDSHGLDLAAANVPLEPVKAAFVSPSNQYPLGVSLRPDRRRHLLDWAVRSDAWIVEDDYDGEYQYVETPTLALKSVDASDRVIYCGTFSKVLFPAIRTAYVIVPEGLTPRFDEVTRVVQTTSATLVQKTIARFIGDGHFARHLNHMRKLYAHRRGLVIDALALTFGASFRFNDQARGIYLVIRLPGIDTELAERAQRAGLAVLPLSMFYASRPCAEGLVLGFTNIDTSEKALDFAQRLKRALDRPRP